MAGQPPARILEGGMVLWLSTFLTPMVAFAQTPAPAPAPAPAPLEAAAATPDAEAAAPSESSASAEAPVAPATPEPSLDALLQRMAALESEVQSLRAQVPLPAVDLTVPTKADKLKPIASPRPGLSLGDPKGFHLDISGYFRTRGYVFGAKLSEGAGVTGGLYANQDTSGRYMTMRLRTGFKFAWKDTASLNVHVQALDNVVWGDNAGISSVALFGEQPSTTRIDGLEAPPIEIFRAWTEVKTPVGIVRVGRQSSHWGLGLLANHGDGFDDDFGENHYGNQFDRFLFGTNPVKIIQTFTKRNETKEIPLTLAIAVDRLVEDPLQQFYGVKCSPGITQADDPDRYNAACDRNADGVTDLDHDYIEDRLASDRTDDWWVDQKDDVWEMVYALIYRGQGINLFGRKGDLTAGSYVIHRLQQETDSNVAVVDFYLDGQVSGFGVQFEGVGILGNTRALKLPDSTQEDPLAKKASIYGYAARLYYGQPQWKVLLESGLATGDNQVNDAAFTGRSLHPDYNVGLLIYEEVLARVTNAFWGGPAPGLRSKGGVYDSHYLFPRVYAYPVRNMEIIAGALFAFPDRADGAIIRCTTKDQAQDGCAFADATKSMLGQELDFALKYRLENHFLLSLETAYAHVTDRVALAAGGLKTNEKGFGNYWTFQSRMAFEF